MRSAVAVLLAAGLVGVGACSSSSDYFTGPSSIGGGSATEAKGGNGGGGGGSQSVAVTGTWGEGAISGGSFAGAILDNDSFHAEGNLGTVQIAGIDGTSGGNLVLVHMNSMRILTDDENTDPGVNADGYARQFTVAWTDGNSTYRLVYGDPRTDDPAYAHVVCTTSDAPPCYDATIDSKSGTYDSTVAVGTVTARATGPRAHLTRQEGKRKAVDVGDFDVPFSLAVAR